MDSILNSTMIKANKLLLEAADNVLAEAKKIWKQAGYEAKQFPNGDFGHFRHKINELYEDSILAEYSRIENEAKQKNSKSL